MRNQLLVAGNMSVHQTNGRSPGSYIIASATAFPRNLSVTSPLYRRIIGKYSVLTVTSSHRSFTCFPFNPCPHSDNHEHGTVSLSLFSFQVPIITLPSEIATLTAALFQPHNLRHCLMRCSYAKQTPSRCVEDSLESFSYIFRI